MAKFKFDNYYDLGTKGYSTAGTWEAAFDPEFTNLIDSVYNDPKAKDVWTTPLEYVDDNGITRAHGDIDKIYVRCKMHIDDVVSNWVYIQSPANQNDQTVIYTENKEIINTVNSLDIGFN